MRKSQMRMARLFADSMKLGFAANQVIAMRLMKMAMGGPDVKRESERMVQEKIDAAAEASLDAARSLATGKPHQAASRALAAYKKRVDSNLRRLTRG